MENKEYQYTARVGLSYIRGFNTDVEALEQIIDTLYHELEVSTIAVHGLNGYYLLIMKGSYKPMEFAGLWANLLLLDEYGNSHRMDY